MSVNRKRYINIVSNTHPLFNLFIVCAGFRWKIGQVPEFTDKSKYCKDTLLTTCTHDTPQTLQQQKCRTKGGPCQTISKENFGELVTNKYLLNYILKKGQGSDYEKH